jgi:hypothetical protein
MPSLGYTIFLLREQNVNGNRLICAILKWIRTEIIESEGAEPRIAPPHPTILMDFSHLSLPQIIGWPLTAMVLVGLGSIGVVVISFLVWACSHLIWV